MATDTSSVDLVSGDVVSGLARAALLAALTGVAAQVAIPYPLSPAPVTLQVLIVFLAGLYLGPVWGGVSMLLYLVAGAAGAPVFAGATGGVGVLVDQTAGFLWSYPVAAAAIGLLVHRSSLPRRRGAEPTEAGTGSDAASAIEGVRDPATVPLPVVLVALTIGVTIIYAGGVAYAAWLLELGLSEAVALFAAPFVPAEVVKMAAAVAIVRSELVAP
ncbi:biotin transporter BioY [Halovivax sp.]|uniref:biotin transporter BioY n=1 Tax=Halovivax sp. TaxID=1935978 RepID=UPI0025BFC534|nr:biotin transporter BioY [Halovivax sp.]